jgi:hypothetical protein
MTRSLFHSRPLADRALARIAADISFPALRCTTFKEYKSTEGFAPIVVPPLCAEDKKEIRRGRNPLQTFRRALSWSEREQHSLYRNAQPRGYHNTRRTHDRDSDEFREPASVVP